MSFDSLKAYSLTNQGPAAGSYAAVGGQGVVVEMTDRNMLLVFWWRWRWESWDWTT